MGSCPSVYVMNRVRVREHVFKVSKFIQDSRWDAIAQQLSRRPDSIRHPCGHGWCHGAPSAW